MSKITAQILKGFRDFGPEEETARQDMFNKVAGVFRLYGFLPMATPVLEYKEILTGKIGEEEKLIYSFKDNGERDVAMRYDLTVPFARFVAMNQNKLTLPFKRSQIGPVWRADKPQKGRFREFFQCDIDVVGSESQNADADVVSCIAAALEAIGVKDFEIKINNRQIINNVLKSFDVGEKDAPTFLRIIDKLDKIGEKEVTKMLSDAGLKIDLGKFKDAWQTEAKDYVENFGALLKSLGVNNFSFEPFLARGLDYYTGMVIEAVLKNNPEFGSVAGGGRYDNLVDTFSSKSVPAVGASIGIDRLFDAMSSSGQLNKTSPVKAIILNLQGDLAGDYAGLATTLRAAGIGCELYYETAKLDKQFKYAETKNIQYAVILGEAEKEAGVVKVKDLSKREEKEIKMGELVNYLK